jgi:hypothetical protein
MQRDFQFYDNEIISYSHTGDMLVLYCMYGFHEKWRTCFYNVASVKGEDNLVGSVIAFFGRETPEGDYTIFFRNNVNTAVVGTKDHWRRLSGWE